jgi:hypothetical protein
MLYSPKTSIVRVVPRALIPGGSVAAEGAVLISTAASGIHGITQSAGNAGEVFAGLAIYERDEPTNLPKQEVLNSGLATTVTTTKAPAGGVTFMRVYDRTAAVVVASGNPANPNEYSLAGSTLTLNAANVGHDLEVTYRYVPSILEARSLTGACRQAGGSPTADIYGRYGVASQGDFYTTEFDTTVDWSAANLVLKTGANGRITVGGNGAVIPGYVVSAPSADTVVPGVAFLGISIR